MDEVKDAQTEQMKQLEEFNPSEGGTETVKSKANFMEELNYKLSLINFPLVIGCFIFYFIGGYLLYGSLFAAIGSAVDNETDTQQFMMPVTIPLILGIVIAQVAMENPDGTLAFWASIIPFTSPIVMMVRIPFGVAGWEVALSMVLLIATFIGSTFMAGKIYRTGILMYGKKVNFKEIGKWLFYKG
jgi:ABC-2 type transport system permease protein